MRTPKIYYETHGDGPIDLVVCNGLSQSTANWRGLARKHTQFRWILFDARGCGKSEIGTRPYHIDDHVSDLLHVLEQTQSEQPIVLGFSHGGRIALRAAAEHPKRMKALALISTGATAGTRRRSYFKSWHACLDLGGVEAMAWASLPAIVGPKILEKYPDLTLLVKGTTARNNEDGLRAMFEGVHEYPSPIEDGPRVNAPCLILRGDQDPLVTEEDGQEMLEWMPNADYQVLEGIGHTLPLEVPGRFIEIMTQFIEKISD